MPDASTHRQVLTIILEAADSYYAQHHRFPSRIRLSSTLARNFMGEAVEAQFPLRPLEPDTKVVILADATLGATELALDA